MSELLQFQVTLPDDVAESGSIAVGVLPFGEAIEHGGIKIQFDVGSVDVPSSVPLTVDHGAGVFDRVGVLTRSMSDDTALFADLDIADTAAGRDVRELMRIGAITDVSAGVAIDKTKEFTDDVGVLHRFGSLDHVSIVVSGAFADAGAGSKVLAVHSEEGETVSDEIETPAVEQEPKVEYASADQVESLRKMVAEISAPGGSTHRGHSYETVGDLLVDVMAFAREANPEAAERLTSKIDSGMVNQSGTIVQFEFPAVGNSIGSGVAYDPFIPELLRLLRDGRPTANLFQSRPLPTEGNRVFMPRTSVGNIVDYQDGQGVLLANQRQDQILTDEPKATIGGGQGVTIQAQLWTNPSYMAAVAEDLIGAYAEFLNDKVVNGNRAADTPASATGYNGIMDAAFGTLNTGATDVPVGGAPSAVIGLLGTAWAAVWNGSKAAPSTAIMSANMWGALINEVDTDNRPIITVSAPSNPAGAGDASTAAGTLRGLNVVVDDAVGDTDIIVTNFKDAILFETSPTPAQLQLTYPDVLVTDISVFGFSSLFVRRPAAFAIMSGITIP